MAIKFPEGAKIPGCEPIEAGYYNMRVGERWYVYVERVTTKALVRDITRDDGGRDQQAHNEYPFSVESEVVARVPITDAGVGHVLSAACEFVRSDVKEPGVEREGE